MEGLLWLLAFYALGLFFGYNAPWLAKRSELEAAKNDVSLWKKEADAAKHDRDGFKTRAILAEGHLAN